MEIKLKQKEIDEAITNYIASGGINLAHKVVNITYTKGRLESGLSAEIFIEDSLEKCETIVEDSKVQQGAANIVVTPPVDEPVELILAGTEQEPELHGVTAEHATTASIFSGIHGNS